MFTLPKLPYSPAALEPYIDEQTMLYHHDKHHAAYVDNLNKALPDKSDTDLQRVLSHLADLTEPLRTTVANHGGGHANHSFFWTIMAPPAQSSPSGKFADALTSTFGSLDKFKEAFTARAMSVFGSGWAFLIATPDGKLALKRHSFQNSPVMHGATPILGLDVWEHAYYLQYQNRRADYISAWWHVVNWTAVSGNFARGQA